MHFFLGSLYYVTNCPIVIPFLNNESILSFFFLWRSGFQRAIYGDFIFFLVLAFFGAFEMIAHVKHWLMLLPSCDGSELYISNFYITSGFTNVTWTRRTISFIDNTWFVRNKETKNRIFLVFHVISILKPLFVNL